MIAEGNGALLRLLPRESAKRPHDLAQLSLIWPYSIVDYDTKKVILANIEKHLLGMRGVNRYPGDSYCGKGLNPAQGEVAEWPLGLAWLAICYGKLAESGRDFDLARRPIQLGWDERKFLYSRALDYFTRLEGNMTPEGLTPEMYVGGKPGHNTPLAWAQSFMALAMGPAADKAVPGMLLERLNEQTAAVVTRVVADAEAAVTPAECVRTLRVLRYERERARVQREIDRLQEAGSGMGQIDVLLQRKSELLTRIEALSL